MTPPAAGSIVQDRRDIARALEEGEWGDELQRGWLRARRDPAEQRSPAARGRVGVLGNPSHDVLVRELLPYALVALLQHRGGGPGGRQVPGAGRRGSQNSGPLRQKPYVLPPRLLLKHLQSLLPHLLPQWKLASPHAATLPQDVRELRVAGRRGGGEVLQGCLGLRLVCSWPVSLAAELAQLNRRASASSHALGRRFRSVVPREAEGLPWVGGGLGVAQLLEDSLQRVPVAGILHGEGRRARCRKCRGLHQLEVVEHLLV